MMARRTFCRRRSPCESTAHRSTPRRAARRRIDVVPQAIRRVTSRVWPRRCASQRRASHGCSTRCSSNHAHFHLASAMVASIHHSHSHRTADHRLRHPPTAPQSHRPIPANAAVHAAQRNGGRTSTTAALSRRIYHHQIPPYSTRQYVEHLRPSTDRFWTQIRPLKSPAADSHSSQKCAKSQRQQQPYSSSSHSRVRLSRRSQHHSQQYQQRQQQLHLLPQSPS